jgi:hypothetical protein
MINTEQIKPGHIITHTSSGDYLVLVTRFDTCNKTKFIVLSLLHLRTLIFYSSHFLEVQDLPFWSNKST